MRVCFKYSIWNPRVRRKGSNPSGFSWVKSKGNRRNRLAQKPGLLAHSPQTISYMPILSFRREESSSLMTYDDPSWTQPYPPALNPAVQHGCLANEETDTTDRFDPIGQPGQTYFLHRNMVSLLRVGITDPIKRMRGPAAWLICVTMHTVDHV